MQHQEMVAPRRNLSFFFTLFFIALAFPITSAQKCGVNGTVKEPYKSADDTITDYETCQRFCMEQNGPSDPYNGCQVYSYTTKTRTCRLYGLTLRQMEFKMNDTAGATFYEEACIPTHSKCDKSNTASLVENGDFEFGNNSIGPWSTIHGKGTVSVAHPGLDSSNAALCAGSCSITNYRGDYCEGALYNLTMNYKFVRAKPGGFPDVGPSLSVQFGDFNGAFQSAQGNIREGEWQSFYGTGRIFGTVSSFPFIQFTSNQGQWHLYLDNVQIKPASQSTSVGANILKNGGFEKVESGVAKPWVYEQLSGDGNLNITSPGLSGSLRKLEYSGNVTSSPSSFPSSGFQLAQFHIPTTPGKSYQISMDYNSIVLPVNTTGGYDIEFGPASWYSQGGQNQTSEQLQAIKHFEREVMATVDKSVLTVSFSVVDATGTITGQHSVVDNLQVREVH